MKAGSGCLFGVRISCETLPQGAPVWKFTGHLRTPHVDRGDQLVLGPSDARTRRLVDPSVSFLPLRSLLLLDPLPLLLGELRLVLALLGGLGGLPLVFASLLALGLLQRDRDGDP